MTHRVVVTGMAGLCPLGTTWEDVRDKLLAKTSGVIAKPEWEQVDGLQTRLAAEVSNFQRPQHYHRTKVRTMGRVALLATRATELALEAAGLLDSAELTNGSIGVAYGSTSGSPPAIQWAVEQVCVNKTLKGITGAQFIQYMSHTCVLNLAQFFEVKGRIIPTCSACTAGSQGIGYAYEAVKYGRQALMIAGGADELHLASAAVFDIMFATSTRNDQPGRTPRPFDVDRDGLVAGEGAATLILESLEHAQRREAPIYAEIVGFATNCDGSHIVNPSSDGMQQVMTLALHDAGLSPSDIDYINAHATATEVGDIAETHATAACFKRRNYSGHKIVEIIGFMV